MKRCNQIGCQTPKTPGTHYRVWVHGEHYDHRTREAAEKRVARLSWYEREAASIQEVTR